MQLKLYYDIVLVKPTLNMKTLKLNIKLTVFLLMSLMAMTAPVYAADTCQNTVHNGSVDQNLVQRCLNQSPIVHDIQVIVDWLSAGVGIIVTIMIVLGGIQYTIAGDNPTALQAARKRIINGLIALVTFIFMFAILQWLIPGGVFK